MANQKILRVCICSILVWLLCVLWLSNTTHSATETPAKIILETSPVPSAIIPDETLVQTRVRVVDGEGQPIPGAWVALHLDTPPSPEFLTTDFPWVEGTTLLDFAVEAPNGEVQFTTMYPIRGTYTFQTQVTLPTGITFNDNSMLSIAESPKEMLNFFLLLFLLFSLGLISGVIVGRWHRATLVLFSLGSLLITSAITLAHNANQAKSGPQIKPLTAQQTNGPIHATLTITPGRGRVGTLNTVEVKLSTTDGNPVPGEVTLVAWHVEDEKPVYTLHLPVKDRPAQVQMQFFDGAEHELRLEATTSDKATVSLRIPIVVEALAPPFWLKIRIFVILMSVVVMGLLIGFRLGVGTQRVPKGSFGPRDHLHRPESRG
jgi:hypothetical protein